MFYTKHIKKAFRFSIQDYEKDREDGMHFTSAEYLKAGEVAKSFWEKGVSEHPPKFVIFLGGVGSGKTSIRRLDFSTSYVHFEFGEIYTAIKKAFGENNPKLADYSSLASDIVLQESLENRKNIVIEIIGDNQDSIETVVSAMKDLGYEIKVKFISCDSGEAYNRHLGAVKTDPDYLSAHFTQEATLSFLYRHLGLGVDRHE